MNKYDITPNNEWMFWDFGGQIIPPHLKKIFDEIADFYLKVKDTELFQEKMDYYRKYFIWRPSPIYFCENLTNKIWWAKIYLKREDLNHTWAHKINHCMWHALIAKMMWKKKIIAETGAGQHGVALATAASVVWLPCEIYMGAVDIAKEFPNVQRMKLLWAKIVSVESWTKTLKDAVDVAFQAFLEDPENIFFGIWSVVWPHPFPMMVRDFQRIIWIEAKTQFQEIEWWMPDNLVACVWWGSNAMGLFSEFLEEENINIYAVEPWWKSTKLWENACTLEFGESGELHGMKTLIIKDEKWEPAPVYSIASGLDYPGVWPQLSFLKKVWRIQNKIIDDQECLDAFQELSKMEWIIPALESAHAIAYALKLAKNLDKDKTILINLSGRWDKDLDFVCQTLGI